MNRERLEPPRPRADFEQPQQDPDDARQGLATMIGQLLARGWLREQAHTREAELIGGVDSGADQQPPVADSPA